MAWLKAANPDVVCLQEIKCQDENFPAEAFEALGYNCAVHGQKSYNGVAILSKFPLEDVTPRLPGGDGDDHARYLEALVSGPKGVLRLGCLYAPNGNPLGEKFTYKLKWLDRLHAHAKELLRNEEPVALLGDYNIIPEDQDCWDPKVWAGDALFQPESRGHYRALLNLGLTDALRSVNPNPHVYTFWDYQAGRWQRDQGIRIDHWLLSPEMADRLEGCVVDHGPRGLERASDHTPVILTLRD